MKRRSFTLLTLLITVPGCTWFHRSQPKPMPAEAFFATGNSMDPATGGRKPVTTAPTDTLILRPPPQRHIPSSATVAQANHLHSTTAPVSSGEYMTLGGVIAEVKGVPIYANRVLREIAPALAANARIMTASEYRNAAMKLIFDQTQVLIDNELAFAAAQQSLEDRDKQLADALTTMWRQRQITEAGGSLELARQHAAEIAQANHLPDDLTFEQLVQEKYRQYMFELWAQRKIKPRSIVTQAEMRTFYKQHINDLFTQHAQARFRLIRINPDASGGREQALAKIRQLRQRAMDGEDFEALARKYNDDRSLMDRGGDVGWIQQNAFVHEKVEKAVWDTPPGHITPIVEDDGSFYIAEVTATKDGHVQKFETQEVQDYITQTIEAQRHKQIMNGVYDLLRKETPPYTDENMMNTALEMAMQAYPRYAAATR
ncbi:MAG TPA: peptidylprolyl isomerase [Tepidisphaeraceae bacterium]